MAAIGQFTIKKIKLIDKREFAADVLDEKAITFVIYMAALP